MVFSCIFSVFNYRVPRLSLITMGSCEICDEIDSFEIIEVKNEHNKIKVIRILVRS